MHVRVMQSRQYQPYAVVMYCLQCDSQSSGDAQRSKLMQRTNSVTADYTSATGATILDVDIAVRYACTHYAHENIIQLIKYASN
jgi:hypothetical protein